MSDPKAHFQAGGAGYAAFRPSYPPEIAEVLAERAPARRLAVDVGCGTGQLSVLLAESFERVLACDVSASQLAAATPHPRIDYAEAPAEALPASEGSADLIAAGQAAHWFDHPRFHAECRRVLAPGGLVALVSYGVTIAPEPIRALFDTFYSRTIGPFWPPERVHVETGYADIPLPFEPVAAPALKIERSWDVAALLGYVETWSAVKAARKAGQGGAVEAFAEEVQSLWPAGGALPFAWPVTLKLGRVG